MNIQWSALFDLRRIERVARAAWRPVAAASVLLFIIGGYCALIDSPPDYLHGDNVRMMYVHVPAAWVALLLYAVIAGCGASFVLFRVRAAAVPARACVGPGGAAAALCLVTGSLWGRPAWGTWWVWDARLTSMLVLLLLYAGLAAVYRSDGDRAQTERTAAYLALLGAIDLPIIHFSVQWWNTLHQPAGLLRADGSQVHPDMIRPLLWMAAAYTAVALAAVLLNMASDLMQRRARRDRLRRLQSDSPLATDASAG